MKENLMNSSHKATNEAYRSGYEAIFGRRSKGNLKDYEKFLTDRGGEISAELNKQQWGVYVCRKET